MAPRKHQHHHALLIILYPFLINLSLLQLSSCESDLVYSDQGNKSVNCSFEALPAEARCTLEYPKDDSGYGGCPTEAEAPAYQLSGGYPPTMADVEVEPAYVGPFAGRCYTGIRVSFKLPRIGLKYLKGVEVQVRLLNGGTKHWCFIFNLTDATLNDLHAERSKQLRFGAVLGFFGKHWDYPVGSQQSFDVQVASLPKKDRIFQKEVTSYPWKQPCLLGPEPEKCTQPWHEELTVTVHRNSAMVKMVCLPKGYYYMVELFWRGATFDSRHNGTKKLEEGKWEATFTDMFPGNYQFGVSVYMVMEKVKDPCVNYRYRDGDPSFFTQCAAEYEDFNITTAFTPRPPAPTSTSAGASVSDSAALPKTTVIAITLSLVGLVAAVVVGVVFVKLKAKERETEAGFKLVPTSEPNNNDRQPMCPPPPRTYHPVSQTEVEYTTPRLYNTAPPEPHDPLDSVSTAQNLPPFDPYLYDQTDPTAQFRDSGVPTPDSAMISPDFSHIPAGVFYEHVEHHDPPGAPSMYSCGTNVTFHMQMMLAQTEVPIPPPEVEVRGSEGKDDGIASDVESTLSTDTL